MRLGIYLVLLFSACAASGQTGPSLPGTFGSGEPLPAPVVPDPGKPSTGGRAPNGPEFPGGATNDPGGDADFAAAKARFDAADGAAARPLLEAFVAHHAQHPARPAADSDAGAVGAGARRRRDRPGAARTPDLAPAR